MTAPPSRCRSSQLHPQYQALNDRRLQRALTQLERLQRQRQLEYVSGPVQVSVEIGRAHV